MAVVMAFTAYALLTGFAKHNVLHTMIKNLTCMYPWYEITSFGKKKKRGVDTGSPINEAA